MYTKNKRLEDLFRRAVTAQMNLKVTESIDLYNKILEEEPENTNVLSNLAKAMHTLGTKTIMKDNIEKTCLDEAQDLLFKSAMLEKKSRKDKAEKLLDIAIFYLHLYKLESSIKYGELAYTLDTKSSRICTTVST